MKKLFFILISILIINAVYGEKIYTVLSRGSVKDNSTGLIWTRCSLSENDRPLYDFNCEGIRKKYTWREGIKACENLTFDGRSDWRLPNIKELQSILFYHHYSQDSDKYAQVIFEVFPNVVSAADVSEIISCRQEQIQRLPETYPGLHDCGYTNIHYWSSTTHKNNPKMAWFIDFYNGNTAFNWHKGFFNEEPKLFIRCVAGP